MTQDRTSDRTSDTYHLGIDLGTTYVAAGILRQGRPEIVTLGDRAPVVPSVLYFKEDGDVLTGESATRRGLSDPTRVVREFKRRVGDATPLVVGQTPYSADVLLAKLLRFSHRAVVERQGGRPASIAVTHPANWGSYKIDVLHQAVRMADIGDISTLTEPVAAAIHYAATERLDAGQSVAVYDLGGGTFDAAVLRRTVDQVGEGEHGFEVLGDVEGIERLGGIDFDEAVFQHAIRWCGDSLTDLDPDDAAVVQALARLRQECVEAKEALSTDTDVSIPVVLPNLQTEVRLTRAEFEAMIRPLLQQTVEALQRAVRNSSVDPDDLSAVLLVGGSSRIPLIAEMVGAELGRPIAVDQHPKHTVALGAAIAAGVAAGVALPTPKAPAEPAPAPASVSASVSAIAAAAPSNGQPVESASPPIQTPTPTPMPMPTAVQPVAAAANEAPPRPLDAPSVPQHSGVRTAEPSNDGFGDGHRATGRSSSPSPDRSFNGAASFASSAPPASSASSRSPLQSFGTDPGEPARPFDHQALLERDRLSGGGAGGGSDRRGAILSAVAAIVVLLVLGGVALAILRSGSDNGQELVTGADQDVDGTTGDESVDENAGPTTTLDDGVGDTEEQAGATGDGGEVDEDGGTATTAADGSATTATTEAVTTTETTVETTVEETTTVPAEQGLSVTISDVALDGGSYVVSYSTNFDPLISSDPASHHLHFFFDSVAVSDAGAPGAGPWILYDGPSPFRGYGPGDRPGSAERLCVTVATHDHAIDDASVFHCFDLPE